MHCRARTLVSLLPLLACLLTLGTPAPAVRSHSSTGQNRSRIQRPVRANARVDGDHHHEEVPHIFVPRDAGDGDTKISPSADSAATLPPTSASIAPASIATFHLFHQDRVEIPGVSSLRSGRSPPASS